MTMTDLDALQQQLVDIFRDELAIKVESLTTDLFQAELLDSLSFVRLLSIVESRYAVEVPLEDMEAETFSTIEKIAAYVRSRSA
jgi:acyl carrier protein